MADQYVSPEQINELAKVLASSDLQAQGATTDKFCAMWPNVEQGLSALQGVVALVPSVGILAGPAIGIVRAAGAAASQAVCKK